jgi:hypothetical protein
MLKADQLVEYEEVWAADSEFEGGDTGEHYRPVCYTATELRSGRIVKLWRDDLRPAPPFRLDAKTLFVCFGASAECGTHLALGWPLPANVIDLAVEFRNLNNGRIKPMRGAFGLIGALTRYGVRESFRPMSYNPRRRLPAWTARPRSPSEAKEMNVKERTIFKEIDELLLGVFGDLTDDEILKRVADQAGG